MTSPASQHSFCHQAGVDTSDLEKNAAKFRNQAQATTLRHTVNMAKMGAQALRIGMWKHHVRMHKKKTVEQRISLNQLRGVIARWEKNDLKMMIAQWAVSTQLQRKEDITTKVLRRERDPLIRTALMYVFCAW